LDLVVRVGDDGVTYLYDDGSFEHEYVKCGWKAEA
jgi:hypothetical protein